MELDFLLSLKIKMKEIDRFTVNREEQTIVSCRGVSELFVCLK